jgi:hypothetical protein
MIRRCNDCDFELIWTIITMARRHIKERSPQTA